MEGWVYKEKKHTRSDLMNPVYPAGLPPGYPGVASITTGIGAVPGVMPPLAYTHGVYSQVSPTYSVPSSLTANGQVAAAPPGGGLLYEGSASPLIRPYGKSTGPYAVPVTHSPAHAYQPSISSAPSHSQTAYTHSLSQQNGTSLYNAQTAYPPGLHPAVMTPSTLYQPQARQLYIPSGTQPPVNPALGLSPGLTARGSPMHTIPVTLPQSYFPTMMTPQPPSGGGAVYPSQAFYPTYHPGFQSLP
ncbi:uncharacterized protein [Diadema antillarum]|uniref:uncharacterized protein isoform X3 n=1 Tax=Diadema antillarum TaxID=105358 RepID=UPI003A8B78C1